MDSTPQDDFHWPSLWLLLFFSLCSLLLLAAAGLLVVLAVSNLPGMGSQASQLGLVMQAGATVAGSVILGIASFYALARLARWPQAAAPLELRGGAVRTFLLTLLWAASLAAGYALIESDLAWVTMPLVTVVTAGVSVWVLARLGLTGLRLGSRLRGWGVFGLGLALGPLLIGTIEFILFIILLGLVLVYLGLNPDTFATLMNLAERIPLMSSPQRIMEELGSVIDSGWAVFILLGSLSVVVPLVEETLKPIGVWLMADRLESPADGFTMGILSGTGYALFENLGASGTVDNWALVLGARVGTSLLHILTSGLVGWALVSAWRERKVLRLAATYALAVILHGLWNGLTVVSSGSIALAQFSNGSDQLTRLGAALGTGLIVLAMVMFSMLILMNRRVRLGQEPLDEDLFAAKLPETSEGL